MENEGDVDEFRLALGWQVSCSSNPSSYMTFVVLGFRQPYSTGLVVTTVKTFKGSLSICLGGNLDVFIFPFK